MYSSSSVLFYRPDTRFRIVFFIFDLLFGLVLIRSAFFVSFSRRFLLFFSRIDFYLLLFFVCPSLFQTGGGRVEVARLILNVPPMFRQRPVVRKKVSCDKKYIHSDLNKEKEFDLFLANYIN